MDTLWTIGHSTRNIGEFISILHHYNISQLVDVRSLPGSNKFPQFNKEELEISLKESNIEYIYLKELGGLRKKIKNSLPNNWKNKSFSNYADYMQTDEFKRGIHKLEIIAQKKPTAIMCSEILWWRCHRSMIADYMKNKGWNVINIQDKKINTPHPFTSVAKIIDGTLTYSG